MQLRQDLTDVGLAADQGQEGAVIEAALVILGLGQAGSAPEEKADGFPGGGGVDQVQLLRGQGRPAEMGQDVVVIGMVGLARIDEDPVAVINDEGRFAVSGLRFSDFSGRDRFHLGIPAPAPGFCQNRRQATRLAIPDSDSTKEVELAGSINQFPEP